MLSTQFSLNLRVSDNFAFFDPTTRIHLTRAAPFDTVQWKEDIGTIYVPKTLVNALSSGRVLDVTGNIDKATWTVKVPDEKSETNEKAEADKKAAEDKRIADEKAEADKKAADEKEAEEKRKADEKAEADKKAAEDKALADQKAADEKKAKADAKNKPPVVPAKIEEPTL